MQPNEWLQYLVDHFLKPGILASRDTSGLFADFTFDHMLEGVDLDVQAVMDEIRGPWP